MTVKLGIYIPMYGGWLRGAKEEETRFFPSSPDHEPFVCSAGLPKVGERPIPAYRGATG